MIRSIKGRGRLIFTLLLLLTGVSQLALAQPGDDFELDYNFDSIPVDDYRDVNYIGFGGGYLGMYSLLNYDELNTVAASFGLEDFSGGLLMNGGGGFLAGVGPENIRLGIYGVGGQLEKTVSTDAFKRTLRLSSSLVALQLDYAIFLPADGLMLFPGVMLGRGTNTLELYQVMASDSVRFDTLFNNPTFGGASDGSSTNRYARISRSTLHLQPTLNLEYAINQFVMIRAGAGYGLNFGGTWNDPIGTEVDDVPDINSDGLSVHFGLFVGLFQK